MNNGQEMFFNFIMDKVALENQEKAKELLMEGFEKQKTGTFNQEYLMNYIPRMLGLIKPEYIDEVKNIMANYKA